LAAGHVLALRFRARFRSFHVFATIELVAAVSGAALVFLFGGVESHFASLAARVLERPWLLGGYRWFGALLLFLVPSTAMGASLPALTGALSRSSSDYGRILGYLYGANTAGGVFGVALAEQWLVPRLGLRMSALVAGGAELAVGLLVIVVASSLA